MTTDELDDRWESPTGSVDAVQALVHLDAAAEELRSALHAMVSTKPGDLYPADWSVAVNRLGKLADRMEQACEYVGRRLYLMKESYALDTDNGAAPVATVAAATLSLAKAKRALRPVIEGLDEAYQKTETLKVRDAS